MAVIKKPQTPESPHYSELVATLAKELQRNQPTGPPTAPQIIEEEQRGSFLHVTVIWDAWNDVEREDRGRLIMDAYEKQRHADHRCPRLDTRRSPAPRRPRLAKRISASICSRKAKAHRAGNCSGNSARTWTACCSARKVSGKMWTCRARR